MQDFAGARPGGHDGVVAQHLGVAEGRALFVLAGHLADGGVDVDDQPPCSRACPHRPRPPQRLAHHRLELTDVAEGEGPQERAQGGGGHHPVREHPRTAARAQHVGVVDVGAAGDDGVHQSQDLAAGQRTADASAETDSGVHQPLETETHDQRADEDEPGVGHQVGVVEAHRDPIDPVRYSTH